VPTNPAVPGAPTPTGTEAIQAGGTITLEFTDPANAPSSKTWGEHLTQNTGDEIFWAGHNGNSPIATAAAHEHGAGRFAVRRMTLGSTLPQFAVVIIKSG
jgi:hypothetical protein